MRLTQVPIDGVVIGKRHRELDSAKVDALAESMKTLGLQQPISVYFDGTDGVPGHLIAGLHRLEAARKLGWETIDATRVDLSPTRREMWEIAENLFRVDLSKEQRDAHIRRYAELLAKDDKEREAVARTECPTNDLRSDGRRKGPQHREGIASKIAEEAGLSQRTVRRALNPPAPKPIKQKKKPRRTVDDFRADVRAKTVEHAPAAAATIASWAEEQHNKIKASAERILARFDRDEVQFLIEELGQHRLVHDLLTVLKEARSAPALAPVEPAPTAVDAGPVPDFLDRTKTAAQA